MSLKENVDFIKDEISTEEKFFEGFFKLEKLWTKYKIAIIGGVTIVIVAFAGTAINNYLQTQNKIKANIAFNTLLENPKDIEASAILKDANPKLFTIATALINTKNQKNEIVNIEFLDEISKYDIAINKNDIEAINKIILSSTFLLKEYAIFQKALMLTLDKKYLDAKETLKLIPSNSSVSKLSDKLKHHLLTH